MITREQVADLQPGDVVELAGPSGLLVRGPLSVYGEGSLVFGPNVNTGAWTVRTRLGDPGGLFADWSLTVVSRAPRPLHDCPDCTHTAATVKVGDAWNAPASPGRYCAVSSRDGYLCCLPTGHNAPHIAGNGTYAVAVWS